MWGKGTTKWQLEGVQWSTQEHPTMPYDQPGYLWRHSNAPLQSVSQLDSTKVVLFSPVQLEMTTRPAKKHRGIKCRSSRREHTCKATSGVAILCHKVHHRHIASDTHQVNSMQHGVVQCTDQALNLW